MRRLVWTLAIVGLMCGFAKISAGTRKPIDQTSQHSFDNVVTINRVHMALPPHLRKVPLETVPEL
jgi:hypothetical protein